MTRHHYTFVDELRKATRFVKEPETAYAVVFHPVLQKLSAEVHDESLGGMGLVLDDATHFCVGQEVEIAYLDSRFRAEVRHVRPHDEGRFLVGFVCESVV